MHASILRPRSCVVVNSRFFRHSNRCYSTNAAEWRQVIRNVSNNLSFSNEIKTKAKANDEKKTQTNYTLLLFVVISVYTIACCDECHRLRHWIRLVN